MISRHPAWGSSLYQFVTALGHDRDDLTEFCIDEVEAGLALYTTSTNGNPLVYDTVRRTEVRADVYALQSLDYTHPKTRCGIPPVKASRVALPDRGYVPPGEPGTRDQVNSALAFPRR